MVRTGLHVARCSLAPAFQESELAPGHTQMARLPFLDARPEGQAVLPPSTHTLSCSRDTEVVQPAAEWQNRAKQDPKWALRESHGLTWGKKGGPERAELQAAGELPRPRPCPAPGLGPRQSSASLS